MAGPTPEPIMKVAMGFMAAKHLFVASEVGLFEALVAGRFLEAMQILNAATEADLPLTREFDLNDDGYNCLAQYVGRAITLGVFGTRLAPRQNPLR